MSTDRSVGFAMLGWQVTRDDGGTTQAHLREMTQPTRGVVVKTQASGLNYKDALALTGRGQIIRSFPCVPGIDGAGVVSASDDDRWQVGQAVFFTGAGAGEERDGGLAAYHAAAADWLLPIPDDWTAASVMALGTAGLTAAQGVLSLERHGLPDGPVVVTGATGGVASIAIRLLVAAGKEVVAVSSKAGDARACQQLTELGVCQVVDTTAFTAHAGKAMEKQLWAGGIDTTGGEPLAALLRQTYAYGSVATCGVAAGADLPVGLFPFVLRGVNLLGLSSVYLPMPERERAWQRLWQVLDPASLLHSSSRISLSAALQTAEQMVRNQHRGRTVIIFEGD